jgi:hypothetical protein
LVLFNTKDEGILKEFYLVQVVEEFLSMEIKVKHISDVITRQFVISDVAVLEIPNLEKNLNREQKLQVKHDPTLVRSYV